MAKLFSPYIDTELTTSVIISPDQMNNEFYINIKNNLINNVETKCLGQYGLICKVYKINDISPPIVIAEDPMCSAKVNVTFNCKLCRPISNKEIICKIDRMNKALMSAVNGPIKIIITPDKISDKFFVDDGIIRPKENKNIKVIESNVFVKVLILSYTFNSYDTEIISIGKLLDIATEEEIDFYNKTVFN